MQEKLQTKFNIDLWLKTLNKVSIEGTCLNIIKATYDRLTANVILNGEKLKAFSLWSGTRQDEDARHLFNVVLEAKIAFSTNGARTIGYPHAKKKKKTESRLHTLHRNYLKMGTCLAVQWLRLHASTAGGTGSIPGQGTKIPHAAWRGQKNQKANRQKNYLKMDYRPKHKMQNYKIPRRYHRRKPRWPWVWQ